MNFKNTDRNTGNPFICFFGNENFYHRKILNKKNYLFFFGLFIQQDCGLSNQISGKKRISQNVASFMHGKIFEKHIEIDVRIVHFVLLNFHFSFDSVMILDENWWKYNITHTSPVLYGDKNREEACEQWEFSRLLCGSDGPQRETHWLPCLLYWKTIEVRLFSCCIFYQFRMYSHTPIHMS